MQFTLALPFFACLAIFALGGLYLSWPRPLPPPKPKRLRRLAGSRGSASASKIELPSDPLQALETQVAVAA
jgi:hypothetical protein